MSDGSTQVHDAVVIGGGPSGLFAAWRLAASGARVALMEAGGGMRASLCPRVSARMRGQTVRSAEKFRLQCDRCVCLTGLGGAAFHFDTNLGYLAGLSRTKIEPDGAGAVKTYSGLERTLGGFDRAAQAVDEVYGLMYGFGLQRPEQVTPTNTSPSGLGQFALADFNVSQAITVDDALGVVDALTQEAIELGLRLMVNTRVEDVTALPNGNWAVHLSGATGPPVVTRNVVVAVGKLGVGWVRELVSRLEVAHQPNRSVDLGVRLEMSKEAAEPLTAACHNPKLAYLNDRGEPVRTFCVCDGGRIMQYRLQDVVLLDGQHCLTTPTQRTNFGIVTTVGVPAGQDGTDYGLDFARAVNAAGAGLPVVQSLPALLRGVESGPSATSSLIRASYTDLAGVIGPQRVADIVGMVERLIDLVPGITAPETVVAAPVVERMFPAIELTSSMASSRPGLYFVGDCSSKIIGVSYGAATGLAAADGILGSAGKPTPADHIPPAMKGSQL